MKKTSQTGPDPPMHPVRAQILSGIVDIAFTESPQPCVLQCYGAPLGPNIEWFSGDRRPWTSLALPTAGGSLVPSSVNSFNN